MAPAASGTPELVVLHEDDHIVVVDKPSCLLSVPGRLPGAPPPAKKRRRVTEFWVEALEAARDSAGADTLAAKFLGGVGSLASIPRRRDRFEACVARAAGRIGGAAPAAVVSLWDALDAATAAAAAEHHGPEAPNALALCGASVPGGVKTVHRLDFETSGVLAFAKSTDAAAKLCAAFRGAGARKVYAARVRGDLNGSGTWSGAIAPDAAARLRDGKPRYLVADDAGAPGAKAAETEWTAHPRTDADVAENATRVRLAPVTGRSHQLRVHCLAAGHPIVGDPLYGPPPTADEPRLCLHAHELTVDHPATGEPTTFSAPAPF